MKVKDFLKKLKDNNTNIEFIEKESGASFSFYTKNELIYNDRFNNYNVKEFSLHKVNNKMLLVIYI